jgi:hypothetical protein
MTKSNTTLGLNKNNFILKVRSRRISKRRNVIHNKINILKKSFKLKRQKIFDQFDNKDDNDMITMSPVKNISRFDLIRLNTGNKNNCTSASNLLKWMSTFKIATLPTHPITNEIIKKDKRKECYNIALNYYKYNIKYDEDLLISLTAFRKQEFFRKFPDILCKFYKEYLRKLKTHVFSILNKTNKTNKTNNSCYCISCLQNPDVYENMSVNDKAILQSIGYKAEKYCEKINDLKEKIANNYFI